ncbi:MAG TPA: Flp family type IVb pilin [Gaiellaceae bacterium]|jgi:pilus assembly protein Flp/PilA|nr:Flp family type IVb pilin [Gaiellaceae bacterium]
MSEQFSLFIVKAFARIRREDGQALAEYALILALVAVVCIGALTVLGTSISAQLSAISTAISAA